MITITNRTATDSDNNKDAETEFTLVGLLTSILVVPVLLIGWALLSCFGILLAAAGFFIIPVATVLHGCRKEVPAADDAKVRTVKKSSGITQEDLEEAIAIRDKCNEIIEGEVVDVPFP